MSVNNFSATGNWPDAIRSKYGRHGIVLENFRWLTMLQVERENEKE